MKSSSIASSLRIPPGARVFLADLKQHLKREIQQQEILIIEREVGLLQTAAGEKRPFSVRFPSGPRTGSHGSLTVPTFAPFRRRHSFSSDCSPRPPTAGTRILLARPPNRNPLNYVRPMPWGIRVHPSRFSDTIHRALAVFTRENAAKFIGSARCSITSGLG